MRKFLLSLLFALGASLPAQGQESLVWHEDLAPAQAEARAGDRLIFVDLYAEWCGWCKVLEREVFSSPEFRKLAADRFVLLRVDTEDGGDGSELLMRYGATSLPTALLLDAQLVSVGSIVGYAKSADYVRMVRTELERHRNFESLFPNRMKSEDLADLLDLADELVQRRDGARAVQIFDRVLTLGALPDDERPWTIYQKADALRMAADWQEAQSALEQGLEAAIGIQDGPTIERLHLLRYQIARDRGDCRGERLALRDFLSLHPQSELRDVAQKTLQQLDSEDDPLCS